MGEYNSSEFDIITSDMSPENWCSLDIEVNSNGNIINGVNHCYAFGKINNETIFSDNDFPCPLHSSPYSNSFYNYSNDTLPYLGGPEFWQGTVGFPWYAYTGSWFEVTGTVRIRNFEWLEGVTMPRWLEEVIIPRFPKIDSNRVPIDIFYGK